MRSVPAEKSGVMVTQDIDTGDLWLASQSLLMKASVVAVDGTGRRIYQGQ